jgi:quinol-cytochrome oxidoreductase complex cytochrome b subunit
VTLDAVFPTDTGGNGEEHGHEEEERGEEPRIGYIGIEPGEEVDEHELDEFVERVAEEAYAKAKVDKIRFIIFGLLFVLVYLSFGKIKGVSERLTAAIDWYTLGTVTGLILTLLVIPSGIIITFFYLPTPTGVYYSVENMTRNAVLAFFRNLHNWSSEIFIFLMMLHSARTISTRTYLGKRKIIWLTGALLLIVGWLAFLGGTFMRGDQEALEGFEHMMFSFTLVPLGSYVAEFFSGELTLMKLTALHIGVAGFATALLIAIHVLMRKVYVHVQRRWKKAVIYTGALTVFLVVQSLFMEAPFITGMEAGPAISGMEISKPPWPIYFLVAGENLFGAAAMVYSLLVFLPLLIFPYVVEFLPLTKAKKVETGEVLFYVGVSLLLATSYWGAASKIVAHIF